MLPHDFASHITMFYDKVNHFIAFFVLGLFLHLSYSIKYRYSFTILLFYGIFIEFSQMFAINRSSEILDVVADTVGILVAIFLYKFLIKEYYEEY